MWLIFLIDLATLLRGLEGILIAGVHITPALLKLKLKMYLNMDKATLDTLFNFKDHQNVPKAIKPLCALYKLSKLPKFVDEGTNQSLVLLGQFIGFLITPHQCVLQTSLFHSQQLDIFCWCSIDATAHLSAQDSSIMMPSLLSKPPSGMLPNRRCSIQLEVSTSFKLVVTVWRITLAFIELWTILIMLIYSNCLTVQARQQRFFESLLITRRLIEAIVG